jgi:hypothetical protein
MFCRWSRESSLPGLWKKYTASSYSFRRQRGRCAVDRQPVLLHVDLVGTETDDRQPAGTGSARHGIDARQQFPPLGRLDDAVVPAPAPHAAQTMASSSRAVTTITGRFQPRFCRTQVSNSAPVPSGSIQSTSSRPKGSLASGCSRVQADGPAPRARS